MILKPVGPRNKPSRDPLSLPISNPRQPTTLSSPSEPPRFNIPVPTLNTPKPSRGLPKIKLDFNLATPFQNVGGQIPLTDDSTVSSAERTIQPQETYSPKTHFHPSQLKLTEPNDQLDGIRETIDKMSISSSTSGTTTTTSLSTNSSNSPSSAHPKDFSDDVLEELDRLGEGAGGAVHKVRDKRSGIVYARKTITTREVAMKHVIRELSIISSSHHVNIVQCYGAYLSPSSSEVKMVMEYCEGGSLEDVGKKIKERGAVVGEKIAGRLAEGILQGLAYLHTKKTIHRDIKPSNILLSREGVVKLSDFGVSGELVNSKVGTFTGTFLYMAPERISGGEYTIRSEVWSTGISMLELVQNRFPFPNDLPPIELILRITSGEPPTLEDEPGVTWSDDMKDFIAQTLIMDDKSRPTPKEMLAHPWIVNVMKQEVQMSRWIRQVWGWPKPKRSKDNINQTTLDNVSGTSGDASVTLDSRELNEL